MYTSINQQDIKLEYDPTESGGHLTRGLLIGFTILAIVVSSIITYRYFALQSVQHSYELAAKNHFTKLHLVVQMRAAAHERTLTLQKMLLQTDPFIRDEEWIRFNQYGADFARSRLSILSMNLTDDEKKLLDYQGNVTKNALDSQKRVVELLEKDQFIAARDVLLRKVIPSKEQVINQLNTFYNFQQKELEKIINNTDKLSQEFSSLLWTVALMIIVFAMTIVVYVVKRSKRIENTLSKNYSNILRQSEEKSQFLTELIDEFRHPLDSLVSHSKAISQNFQNQGLNNRDVLPHVESIKNACQHLNGLTSDIRELTKAESGKFALSSSEINIHDFVHDIAKQIKPIAAKNNNQIEVQCPQHIGNIDTDPTKLRQILFNLLANACKYTEFGLITLNVKPVTLKTIDHDLQHWVTFSVIDTGIGIAQDKVDKLFSANHSFHKIRQKSSSNSGLNLSISRRMAHVLGGEISVNSEPGMGSVFSVRLPYASSQMPTHTLQ